VAWGLAAGVVLAAVLIVLRPLYIPLFTRDLAVQDLVWSLVVVLAATQPVGATLYVLDAVLIGAGDGRYLAQSMLVSLLVFLPLAVLVLTTGAGVVALWWALGVWLLARQIGVFLRYRSTAWLEAPGRTA
jgi:Na+-driven multidrug efflux pump